MAGLKLGLGLGLSSQTTTTANPSQFFDFTSGTLSSEWTYTGNSGNGTFTDSNGDLQQSTNNQPRFDHNSSGDALGILMEEARTNKLSGENYNPESGDVATTFTVVSGTGTITVVDSATELANAGLDSICTNGDVYAIASTGGDTYRVHVDGQCGNTNAHSLGVWIAYSSTSYHGTFKLEGDSATQQLMQDTSSNFREFRYLEIEGATPTATSREMEFNVSDGRTIYVILMNLQEGDFMTSLILGNNTRARDKIIDASAASRDYFQDSEGTIIMNAINMEDDKQTDSYYFIAANGTGFADCVGISPLAARSKASDRVYANSVRELGTDIHGIVKGREWPAAATWKNGGNARTFVGPATYEEEALANDIADMDRINLGGRDFVNDFNGWIKDIRLYPTERSITQVGQSMILSTDKIINTAGQSNMDGYFSDQNDAENGGEKAMLSEYDTYRTSTRNFIARGATPGSALLRSTNSSNYWYNDTTDEFDGQAYTRWLNITNATNHADVEAILWDQGESDVGATKSVYKAALLDLFDHMRTIIGSVPIIIVPINGRTDSEQNGYQMIREVQWELADENSYVHLAPEKFDNELEASGPHLTNAGYAANAPRVIRKTMDVLGETVSGGVDGPTIASAVRSGTTVTVTITHDGGTDFTPTSGIEGFRFFDDASEISITAAVRTNATTITLTLNSTPSGVETLYYGFRALFGVTLSNLVVDNDSEGNLPLRSAEITL